MADYEKHSNAEKRHWQMAKAAESQGKQQLAAVRGINALTHAGRADASLKAAKALMNKKG